ncbi:sentrin-specific protease 5-like [Aplochiton taeniatus]
MATEETRLNSGSAGKPGAEAEEEEAELLQRQRPGSVVADPSLEEVSGSAPEPGVTALEPEPGCPMQVDQDQPSAPPQSAPLSNGTTPLIISLSQADTNMEVEPSGPPLVPPVPVSLSTDRHPYAMRDHQLYCRPGTWSTQVQDQRTGLDPGESGTSPDQTNRFQISSATSNQHLLIEMVHEFLEGFYVKYGSFIPLSNNDVLEYLKKRCSSELKDRHLDIPGEVCRYRAGLASAPVAGFKVSHNKHTLTLEDLSTLEEQNWLNDQVINMYGELIMEATQNKVHFFNSFFHRQLVAKGYEGVKRWTKKVDLFSKSLLLVPIHLEIHWSLITVDMATKTINYYDSQGIVFKHTIDNIMKYILSEAKEKEKTSYQKGWRMVINKGIPQQKNDSDCGVFVLEYCRCLSVKQPLKFSQEDMPRVRKRIYKELCDCQLTA